MRAVFFVTFAILTGCASSMERVQAMRDNAPEWYADRKVEIAGKSYPSIGDIPTVTSDNRPGIDLLRAGEMTSQALADFLNDPRATPAAETPAEMLTWAESLRRAIGGQVPAPDFLTDEDVDALHALFDRPRGRL